MNTMRRSMDRKSSIEMESLTLNFGEIHFAREAALYVLNTVNKEAAANIFTEGLEPVVTSSITEDERGAMTTEFYDCDQIIYQNPLAATRNKSSSCNLRDVATAPF